MPTDRQYTGQRREASLGFYDYVARQYDPALGRFLQADSIIPNPGNPQSLNRYSYVLNSPLRYTDPSGHFEVPEGECGELCQLLGFSDWDTFNVWWSKLKSLSGGLFQRMLINAKWGDMLSFTWDPQMIGPRLTQNMVFAKDFDTGKLTFWDVDEGISVNFWNVEEQWLAGYRQTGSAGELVPFTSQLHPWNADSFFKQPVTINGNGEYIAFDNAWGSSKRFGAASAFAILFPVLADALGIPLIVDMGIEVVGSASAFAEMSGYVPDTNTPYVHTGSEDMWWLAQMR
jgi:RHS repeat-associated protein